MSTSRSRRAPSSSREALAAPAALVAPVHAGGDSPRAARRTHSNKTRKEFPESVRYDLENALIGLCDVWFEEIKPHLVRNNIKLHLNTKGGEGGDFEAANSSREPPCAHLDPAAGAEKCGLCRLLSKAAHGIESAVSQAAGAAARSYLAVASPPS